MSDQSDSRIVVGLGARMSATATEVLGLIDSALSAHGLTRAEVALCTTAEQRLTHPALVEVAAILGVRLLPGDLNRAVPNPSQTVYAHLGVPSVAEASAMTFGPLIAEKQRSANATCALARLQPSAAITASTLLTSNAGA